MWFKIHMTVKMASGLVCGCQCFIKMHKATTHIVIIKDYYYNPINPTTLLIKAVKWIYKHLLLLISVNGFYDKILLLTKLHLP